MTLVVDHDSGSDEGARCKGSFCCSGDANLGIRVKTAQRTSADYEASTEAS